MRGKKHKVIFLFSLLLFLSGCAVIAGKTEDDSDFMIPNSALHYEAIIEGEPQFSLTVEGGFYIWKTGNTWHVRIAKKESAGIKWPQVPEFSGSISIERGIPVRPVRINQGPFNEVRMYQDMVNFNFRPYNDVEGFDFKIKPYGNEYCITVDVMVNGIRRIDMVHLGWSRRIPDELPFRICLKSFTR